MPHERKPFEETTVKISIMHTNVVMFWLVWYTLNPAGTAGFPPGEKIKNCRAIGGATGQRQSGGGSTGGIWDLVWADGYPQPATKEP